jgi:UDP-N-acetylmuramoyl-tripeptide--D-alanyl-D-alanine ligase
MEPFESNALAEWTGGSWNAEQAPELIKGFAFDARLIKAGECFIALSGGARDGHAFCAQAVASGAIALMVETVQPIKVPQLVVSDTLLAMGAIANACRSNFHGSVIGITGSCGKTSTKEMLRVLLGDSRTHATAGNWNNRIGVPMTLFKLDRERHDFAVIEAGINQPGEMALLGEMIEPDVALVTMIGAAHLELLHSLEGIAMEKSALVNAGKSRSPLITTSSVMNYSAFRKFADRAIVLIEKGASFELPVAQVVRYELAGTTAGKTELHLELAGQTELFTVKSASRGICMNAALALTTAYHLGVSVDLLQERLLTWEPQGNRGRIVENGNQSYYVDCYNANPDSMRDALHTFRSRMEASPRCYVLGAMNELGDQAVELHEQVGRQLKLRTHDVVYFVGPREWREAYLKGALASGARAEQVFAVEKCEEIKSFIAEFSGSIFLKGSRSYALETLLPATP